MLLPLPTRLYFHRRLFVHLLAGLCKIYSTSFTKFDGKVAHRPRKRPSDFGGNPDHITLGLGLELWLGVLLHVLPWKDMLLGICSAVQHQWPCQRYAVFWMLFWFVFVAVILLCFCSCVPVQGGT